MRYHYLRVWEEFFSALESQEKRFEIRVNDRDFNVGDILVLEEWNNKEEKYTGKKLFTRVSYMIQGVFGLPKNLCVMSLKFL